MNARDDWEPPARGSATPRQWALVLGVLGVANYALLAFLGGFSLTMWAGRWPGEPTGFVASGILASGGILLFAALTTIAKAFRWWQLEMIVLWFLMACLVSLAIVESFGPGWPEWVAAEAIFLLGCAHRTVSLSLFAKHARWGAEHRHLIVPKRGPLAHG